MSARTSAKPETRPLPTKLAAALADAHQDAAVLARTKRGGRRSNDEDDESWWYYAATPDVVTEARRLLQAHRIALFFRRIEHIADPLGSATLIRTIFTVMHRDSGEQDTVVWEAPPFTVDADSPTLARLGTARHAKRCVYLLVLGIEIGDRVQVPAAPATVSPMAIGPVAVSTASPPCNVWHEPQGGLVSPGLLGGEDPEADLAARGEVVELSAVFPAIRRWVIRTGRTTAELMSTLGVRVDPGETMSVQDLVRVRRFLLAEGDWTT